MKCTRRQKCMRRQRGSEATLRINSRMLGLKAQARSKARGKYEVKGCIKSGDNESVCCKANSDRYWKSECYSPGRKRIKVIQSVQRRRVQKRGGVQ